MAIAAITVDLHRPDEPDAIVRSAERLAAAGMAATYFVPTALVADARFRPALQDLARRPGLELASHSHEHDFVEIEALARGRAADLRFLRESRDRFSDFFVRAPRAFRSPAWCGLGPAARDTLVELGYRVDSSATPQRPGILGSFPHRNPWLFSRRDVHELVPGLLEVPTSTLGVPLGSPTFATARRRGSLALLEFLLLEAEMFPARVLTLQFHPNDLVAAAPIAAEPMRWTDLLPRRRGGIRARELLRTSDPDRLVRIADAVLARMRGFEFLTLSGVAERFSRRPRFRGAEAPPPVI